MSQCSTCNPICNKCGKSSNKISGLKIAQEWGYFSTGKDMDVDHWHLCSDCYEELKSSLTRHCSKCHRSEQDVAAELLSRNFGALCYQNLAKANKIVREKNYFIEMAKIGNYILCEICYEEYILSFKKPPFKTEARMNGRFYDTIDKLCPDDSNKISENRIEDYFNFIKEDSLARAAAKAGKIDSLEGSVKTRAFEILRVEEERKERTDLRFLEMIEKNWPKIKEKAKELGLE